MKDLPIAVKVVINMFLGLLYIFVSLFSTGFILGLFAILIGFEKPDHDTSSKIGVVALFITIIITAYFRRFFYLGVFKKQADTNPKEDIVKKEM